jgi:predicted TIM-barrel fold metal-dependent hydrolase
MDFLKEFGACDCHSHVFGPFSRFMLSDQRTFDPPESPISALEEVWSSLGIERAVLVQGSAHGNDPSALLDAIARSPANRRGVVLLGPGTSERQLAGLRAQGVRGVRFNWIRHLLGRDTQTPEQRLAAAARLAEEIAPFKWHVEIHLDADDLDMAERIPVPAGMPVVIDHMARIDMSKDAAPAQIKKLLRLLESERFWVKVSGADRLALNSESLSVAIQPMRELFTHAADRCIWGLDWPHVNLSRKRSDMELAENLRNAAGGDDVLKLVLVKNPAKLYGFDEERTSAN